MNHPFVINAARTILDQPEIASDNDTDARIERLVRLILCRRPDEEDQALARAFLADGLDGSISWLSFVQALLMANEFVFGD